MCFIKPVSMVLTTSIDASSVKPCASDEVLAGDRKGRHAIEISAVSKVYIGDGGVTSSKGRPIAAGETVTIPVSPDVKVPCYVVGGSCVLTEYF